MYTTLNTFEYPRASFTVYYHDKTMLDIIESTETHMHRRRLTIQLS